MLIYVWLPICGPIVLVLSMGKIISSCILKRLVATPDKMLLEFPVKHTTRKDRRWCGSISAREAGDLHTASVSLEIGQGEDLEVIFNAYIN